MIVETNKGEQFDLRMNVAIVLRGPDEVAIGQITRFDSGRTRDQSVPASQRFWLSFKPIVHPNDDHPMMRIHGRSVPLGRVQRIHSLLNLAAWNDWIF